MKETSFFLVHVFSVEEFNIKGCYIHRSTYRWCIVSYVIQQQMNSVFPTRFSWPGSSHTACRYRRWYKWCLLVFLHSQHSMPHLQGQLCGMLKVTCNPFTTMSQETKSFCFIEEMKGRSNAFCKWQPPIKSRLCTAQKTPLTLCFSALLKWRQWSQFTSFDDPQLKAAEANAKLCLIQTYQLFMLRDISSSIFETEIHSEQPHSRMKYIE